MLRQVLELTRMIENDELWQYPDVVGASDVSQSLPLSIICCRMVPADSQYIHFEVIHIDPSVAWVQPEIIVQEESKKRKLEGGQAAGAGSSATKDLIKSEAICESNEEVIKQQVRESKIL
jgi:hypothetical protein